MRRCFSRFAVLLFLAATPAMAEDFPAWAYPVVPPFPAFDSVTPKSMPGSDRQYTEAQIEDDYNPPDWFPQDHPPMPKVVAHGTPPAVRACSKCHVPNGAGHPESSDLAGLSANYITAVMADYKGNNRNGIRNGTMIPIAKQISDAEIAEAAAYFAALKPIEWTKVVETDTVATSAVGLGGMRFATADGGQEPISGRIIELPVAPERMAMRDSRTGFIAYVPKGSVARGEALVKGEGGKTLACAGCHGADLRGLADVPHITGRSPMYVFRQLNDIKLGQRTGPSAETMRPVVANLSQDDMVDISAYLANRGR